MRKKKLLRFLLTTNDINLIAIDDWFVFCFPRADRTEPSCTVLVLVVCSLFPVVTNDRAVLSGSEGQRELSVQSEVMLLHQPSLQAVTPLPGTQLLY